jgi:hypothetical protein
MPLLLAVEIYMQSWGEACQHVLCGLQATYKNMRHTSITALIYRTLSVILVQINSAVLSVAGKKKAESL